MKDFVKECQKRYDKSNLCNRVATTVIDCHAIFQEYRTNPDFIEEDSTRSYDEYMYWLGEDVKLSFIEEVRSIADSMVYNAGFGVNDYRIRILTDGGAYNPDILFKEPLEKKYGFKVEKLSYGDSTTAGDSFAYYSITW